MQLDTVKYLLRVLRWRLRRDMHACPSCGSRAGAVVDNKWLITSLVRCKECGLAYRRPQEPVSFSEEFYQEEYQSSLATQLPSLERLAEMKRANFTNTEKDFSKKLEVLKGLGLESGCKVLDFGASWGYGVYQLKQLGYDARGLELSRPRAKYGESNLDVSIATSMDELESKSFDAVFTNHVLEHITNPLPALESIFRVLRPGGFLIAFFPNGSEACQKTHPRSFHCHWGRLHPIYLTDDFLRKALGDRAWLIGSLAYGTAPLLDWVTSWDRGSQLMKDVSQTEMMLLVRG